MNEKPFEPEMVRIPAGVFLMGSDPTQDDVAHGREQPQHSLYLPDYALARTPVTNAQYAVFVETTGHRPPDHWPDGALPVDKADHPVVHVSWTDALAYCRWLAALTGRPYRLPSEAEWEKGASWAAGDQKQGKPGEDGAPAGRKWRYPWGEAFDATRCNTQETGVGDTTPVGAYPQGASPYGLLDMAGNVYEWTLSLWGKDMQKPDFGYPYDPGDGREDLDAGNGVMRVLRGGAFYYSALYARAPHRVKSYPDYRVRTRGFRVCCNANLPESS
jgi:formylglycine-generating enzyme required for sulfatase activity